LTPSNRHNRLVKLVSKIVHADGASIPLKIADVHVKLMPRIRAFSAELLAFIRVNRAVHMQTYSELIQLAITEEEGDDDTSSSSGEASSSDEAAEPRGNTRLEEALAKKIKAKQANRKRKVK